MNANQPRPKNQPIDRPGLPTLAEVEAAMDQKDDRTLATLVLDAWNRLAWGDFCYAGISNRRQACYESAAAVLHAYRIAKAASVPVVRALKTTPAPRVPTTVLFDASEPRKVPGFARGTQPRRPAIDWDAMFAEVDRQELIEAGYCPC